MIRHERSVKPIRDFLEGDLSIVGATHMILWTIQKEDAWEHLKHHGCLVGTIDNITESSWISSYRRMMDKMNERIGAPPSTEAFPVWA